jgi:cystathionine beta-lyase/cystathionine gamma-synthase
MPAQTADHIHAGISREDRLYVGIGDGLIRMSVGIEATGEIVVDLADALGGV